MTAAAAAALALALVRSFFRDVATGGRLYRAALIDLLPHVRRDVGRDVTRHGATNAQQKTRIAPNALARRRKGGPTTQ